MSLLNGVAVVEAVSSQDERALRALIETDIADTAAGLATLARVLLLLLSRRTGQSVEEILNDIRAAAVAVECCQSPPASQA